MGYSRHWKCVWANFWLLKFTVISVQGIRSPKNCSPDFYLPSQEKCTLPCTSPDLVQILLSDQLWAALPYLELDLSNFPRNVMCYHSSRAR
jgi:hypothetical protein